MKKIIYLLLIFTINIYAESATAQTIDKSKAAAEASDIVNNLVICAENVSTESNEWKSYGDQCSIAQKKMNNISDMNVIIYVVIISDAYLNGYFSDEAFGKINGVFEWAWHYCVQLIYVKGGDRANEYLEILAMRLGSSRFDGEHALWIDERLSGEAARCLDLCE